MKLQKLSPAETKGWVFNKVRNECIITFLFVQEFILIEQQEIYPIRRWIRVPIKFTWKVDFRICPPRWKPLAWQPVMACGSMPER